MPNYLLVYICLVLGASSLAASCSNNGTLASLKATPAYGNVAIRTTVSNGGAIVSTNTSASKFDLEGCQVNLKVEAAADGTLTVSGECDSETTPQMPVNGAAEELCFRGVSPEGMDCTAGAKAPVFTPSGNGTAVASIDAGRNYTQGVEVFTYTFSLSAVDDADAPSRVEYVQTSSTSFLAEDKTLTVSVVTTRVVYEVVQGCLLGTEAATAAEASPSPAATGLSAVAIDSLPSPPPPRTAFRRIIGKQPPVMEAVLTSEDAAGSSKACVAASLALALLLAVVLS